MIWTLHTGKLNEGNLGNPGNLITVFTMSPRLMIMVRTGPILTTGRISSEPSSRLVVYKVLELQSPLLVVLVVNPGGGTVRVEVIAGLVLNKHCGNGSPSYVSRCFDQCLISNLQISRSRPSDMQSGNLVQVVGLDVNMQSINGVPLQRGLRAPWILSGMTVVRH